MNYANSVAILLILTHHRSLPTRISLTFYR